MTPIFKKVVFYKYCLNSLKTILAICGNYFYNPKIIVSILLYLQVYRHVSIVTNFLVHYALCTFRKKKLYSSIKIICKYETSTNFDSVRTYKLKKVRF